MASQYDSDSDEEYVYYGTPLEDETAAPGLARQKVVKDPSLLRALPVWQQTPTDDQGRKRFHGAFTGGYSAGYYNSVGSVEGFQPMTFKSSRTDRGERKAQAVEDFLDEDELEERQKSRLQLKDSYDTFGDAAADQARLRAAAEASARPSIIPGPLLDELIVPVASSIGVRLLQSMGWRPGKGIGTAASREAAGGSSKWGTVSGVSIENTPMYVLQPKEDLHGIGFDPFRDAEEFRPRKKGKQQQATGGAGGSGSAAGGHGQKRDRGVAFGTGVLDDDDTLGDMLEDYVSRPDKPTDREAFAFEEIQEEEDDEDRFNPRSRQAQPARLGAGQFGTLPQLQSREQLHKHGSFVPGFVLSKTIVQPQEYPAPLVPPDFRERHVFLSPPPPPQAAQPADASVPEVPPPADVTLRRKIDSLAAVVARSGQLVEDVARKEAASAAAAAATNAAADIKFGFLIGGEGASYYAWRLHKIKSAIAAATGKPLATRQPPEGAPATAGGRRPPLSVTDRMALLGEQPLSSTSQQAAAASTLNAALQPATTAPAAAAPVGRQALTVAEADRTRLQQQLQSQFVRGAAQDMGAGGLQPQRQVGLQTPAAKLLAATADRFTSGSTPETAMLLPGQLQPPAVDKAAAARALKPVRSFEDWRPEPLLCRRFNVPDPYKNKPTPQTMSMLRTDYLALPDTAAAAAAMALPPPPAFTEPSAGVQLPPPPSAEADSAALMAGLIHSIEAQLRKADEIAAAQAQKHLEQQQQQQQQLSAASSGAADAVADVGAALSATADAAAPVAAPVDLFKAIFEADDEEEDDSADEDNQAEEQRQQQQQQQRQQAARDADARHRPPSGDASRRDPPAAAAGVRGAGENGPSHRAVAAAAGPTNAHGHRLNGDTSAKALADALMRARDSAAAKQQREAPHAANGARVSTSGRDGDGDGAASLQQEIRDALETLKSRKSSKKKRHKGDKKERKHKRKHDKDEGKSSKHKRHKKHKPSSGSAAGGKDKEKRRKTDSGSEDSGSDSSDGDTSSGA